MKLIVGGGDGSCLTWTGGDDDGADDDPVLNGAAVGLKGDEVGGDTGGENCLCLRMEC